MKRTTPKKSSLQKLGLLDIVCLNQVAAVVHRLAREKGWHKHGEPDGRFLARTVANMHSEVSELWEAYRHRALNRPCDKAELMVAAGLPALTCAEEELADIIIRALESSRRLKIDIGRAVSIKHLFNRTRPYRHGGKLG